MSERRLPDLRSRVRIDSKEVDETRQKMAQLDEQMAKSTKSTSGMSGAMDSVFGAQGQKKLSDFGRTMSTKVTLPLAAGAAAALKLNSDFSTTFTEMQGLAGVAAEEVDGLRESVFELSSATGRGPQELAEGLNFIRSSGLEGATALDALDRSARSAAVGMGSTVVISDAVTSAMNAYGHEALSAAEATDILVAAVGEGKGEPEEMANQFGRLLPVASELGVEFAEVGGALAFLTLSSGSASQSSSQLSGIMQKLLRPSQQANEVLESVGLSAETLRRVTQDEGLLVALQLLWDRLDQNGTALGMVIEDSRAFTGALALLRDEGREAAGVIDAVTDSTGALDEAFASLQETDEFKARQAMADLQVAAIQAGSVMAPVLADLAGLVGDVAQAFVSLPDPVQRLIIILGAVAAAAGPAATALSSLGKGADLLQRLLNTSSNAGPVLAGAAVGVGVLVSAFVSAQREAQAAQAAVEDLANAANSAGKTVEEVFRERLARSWSGFDDGLNVDNVDYAVEKIREMGLELEFITGWVSGDTTFQQMTADLDNMASAADGLNWDRPKVIGALQDMRTQAEAATAQQAELEEVNRDLGLTTDDTAASTSQLESDLADLNVEQTESIKAAEEQAEAYEEAQEALNGLVDAVLGAFDAETKFQRGLRDTKTAIDEYILARQYAADHRKDTEAQEDALRAYQNLEDTILRQAQNYVALQEAQAEAAGETYSAEQRTADYREALLLLADQLSPSNPLRARLAELIADLGEIGQEHEASIVFDMDLTGLERAKALLDAIRDSGLTSSVYAPVHGGHDWGGGAGQPGGGRSVTVPLPRTLPIPQPRGTTAPAAGAGDVSVTVNVTGQPDAATLARLKSVARDAVAEGIDRQGRQVVRVG